MKIEVHHREAPSMSITPREPQFTHVATITIPDDVAGTESFEVALEYAWRWTNNIEGSWSRGARLDDPHGRLNADGAPVTWQNGDHNPNTEVVAPLPTHHGVTYGHRSSMVHDHFVIVDEHGHRRTFVVASFGFERVPE